MTVFTLQSYYRLEVVSLIWPHYFSLSCMLRMSKIIQSQRLRTKKSIRTSSGKVVGSTQSCDFKIGWGSWYFPHCEQSFSKTRQRESKRCYAETVSSLLSRRNPSFLGSARIIFLTRRRSKASLPYENQYGVYECNRDLAWVWNCLQATACAYSIKTSHDFCRVLSFLRG